MKISQIVCQILRIENVEAKTASSQDAVIVRVRTDSGLEGIGEADASPEVVKAIVDAPFSHNIACGLREILIGENPLETERLWQKMYRRTMYFGRTSVGIAAMAAVDMALWDLKGKHYHEPIHRLLGGKQHDKIRAYASILFGHDGQATRDIACRWRDAGYTAVKCGWEPMGTSEAVDIDLVRGRAKGLAMARCSSTLAACGTRGPPCGAPTLSPSSASSGWKNRCARTIWTATVGCATARRCRLPRAKENAAEKRFAPGSIAMPSTFTRSTCRGVVSLTLHLFARGSRSAGAALQPQLHQPADRRGQFALAVHVPRCVPV